MKVQLNIDLAAAIGEVSGNFYGGFVEHLGRNVYGGVYDPADPTADEDGFRTDVLEAVRDLDMPVTRYPGGCFSSSWCWEDGVGKYRPVRLDPYWKQKDPNTFGIDEFMKWARKAGTEPLLTINVGLRSAIDAERLVEYCNHPSGTTLSDARRANGAEEPYHIRLFCLGNEQYGRWEYGHAPADVYAQKARECVKIVRDLCPDAKFILSGSGEDMGWNREALAICYDYVDYLSLHLGFYTPEEDADFFGKLRRYARFFEDAARLCEELRLAKKSEKRIKLAIDEWFDFDGDATPLPGEKWTVGMHLLEQNYNLRDVLVTGGALSMFHNHADIIDMACIAQSVNVLAPIRTEKNGVLWKQGTYYPFFYASRYGRGAALRIQGAPDTLFASAVFNGGKKTLALFLTNEASGPCELSAALAGFSVSGVEKAVTIVSADESAWNTPEASPLAPAPLEGVKTAAGGTLQLTLPARSWNCVVLHAGPGEGVPV